MAKIGLRLQRALGLAVYEAWCIHDSDDTTARRVVGSISDLLDAEGIDPAEFERAAGFDDEERLKMRLARIRRIPGHWPCICTRCGEESPDTGPCYKCGGLVNAHDPAR